MVNGPDNDKTGNKTIRMFIGGLLTGLIGAFVLFCVVFYVTKLYSGYQDGSEIYNVEVSVADSELLQSETLQKLATLEAAIDKYYYKTDVSVEDEQNGLYRGLLDSLGDPYSVYYTAEELNELLQDTEGIYYGIGAYVSLDQELEMPRISGFIAGSPAESADLEVDDIIYQVNGEDTQGLELSEVVKLIKGEEGTYVTVTVIRDGEYVETQVQRQKIESPTVNSKMLDNNIGYVQITEFDEVTPDQYTEAVAELKASGMEGLIIDLRSNPGGNVSAVCSIAEQILPKGVIFYTEDRDGNRTDYECDGTQEIDIPLVVLVNQYSASASEILSGAIKDYGIGTLVGVTTYGKGVVQRVFDFSDGTAVKLTISSYYTPAGNNIHGIGITPDIEVEFDSDAYSEDGTDNQLDAAVEEMMKKLGN
ncbi:MAG: S41 family peptidase [Butyrivibrio sp.]|nr:S41 family peptidase [Butyrivibrio sp.]